MNDRGAGIEQGSVVEQRPNVPAPKPQELITPRPHFVGPEETYRNESAHYQTEQVFPGKKAWELIERAAERNENLRYLPPKEELKSPSAPLIADKLKRQSLLIQARMQGVKDLDRFEELTDYLESTVSVYESKYIRVKEGLSEEKKKKIIEKWESEGWSHEKDYDSKDIGGKREVLYLRRDDKTLHIGKAHIELMKHLISSDNNPIELVEGLRKTGFRLSGFDLNHLECRDKLGQLFAAPHVREALELAQGISMWGAEWYSSDGIGGREKVAVGQIDFLIKLAQSADPKSDFPPEQIKKIDLLSRALGVEVNVTQLENLQTIIANSDYLDFAGYLAEQRLSVPRVNAPILENIVVLDQAGVLRPLIELQRCGVPIEVNYLSALAKLFQYRVGWNEPGELQKLQKEAVEYVQQIIDRPGVKSLLENSEKREFAGLCNNLSEHSVTLEYLQNDLLDSAFEKKTEIIYIVKLMNSNGGIIYGLDFKELSAIASNQNLIEVLVSQDFSIFLQTLHQKTGYKPSIYDLRKNDSSDLVGSFNDPEVRDALIQDTTAGLIRALHPDGRVNLLRNSERYIRLAKNPTIVQAVHALRGLGDNFKDSYSTSFEEVLGEIINYPGAVSILESPELKSLSARLIEEFKWEFETNEVRDLLALHDDKELQGQLFIPENLEFVKKIIPQGLYLSDIKPMLDLDPARRDLMVQMVSQFSYNPDFDPTHYRGLAQEEMLNRLVGDGELKAKLFSKETQGIFKRLNDFGYRHLAIGHIETIVNAPIDFPDFIGELKDKYNYKFRERDLASLLQLAKNKEGLNGLLDTLASHGYSFQTEDIASISQLMPHVERLPTLLATVSQVLSSEEITPESARPSSQYVFKVQDIPFLLQLEPVIDRLPATVIVLREIMDYRFNIRDSRQLAFVIEGGYTKERLIGLKRIYDRYKLQSSGGFNISAIQSITLIEGNEDAIARLENYNYKFNLAHTQFLREFLQSPQKELIFHALDMLRDNFHFFYNPSLSSHYAKLAYIPEIEDKLRGIESSVEKEDLMRENTFKLFVALNADVALYSHARKLMSDDYFRNIRDAQNRFGQFNNCMLNGEIPDEVLAKIFAVSEKATELDRIALKYGINAEIAKVAENTEWRGPLLQVANFQEANEVLTKMMTDLAIPVIYSDLQGEALKEKQNELRGLAGRDKEFDDILEINCRVVGVYGQKYPGKGEEFGILMAAIKQSLELNLERDPKVYSEKRAEFSEHQFDRIFEGMPEDVRERIMKVWLDLLPRRRLRVSGDIVTAEEATLNRLNRIRDIVHTDLSVHLQELFITKVRELEAAADRGETHGPGAEQLSIYRQYLMTPEGEVRQDIPTIYRSVETFIRDAQAALKSPKTSKEEKVKLGKNLGAYQGISASLKAIYRLETISEERYKVKRDYLNEIDKHIGEFSGALKRLRLLDPDKRSTDVNTRVLEEEVLLDFGKLKGTMAEENVSGQTVFETESTVAFRNLARAPEITQSCQRLTETTGYNHAAYSRLLDGPNEMIDIYEMRNGERNRLARSFVELSKVRLTGEDKSRLVVLIDREYVNPQYQNFGYQFSSEMMLHMLDRLSVVPELSLVFDSTRFTANPDVQEVLRARGYGLRQVSGEYFINESNVKLYKYYDSLGGLRNVQNPTFQQFGGFYIIEKADSNPKNN